VFVRFDIQSFWSAIVNQTKEIERNNNNVEQASLHGNSLVPFVCQLGGISFGLAAFLLKLLPGTAVVIHNHVKYCCVVLKSAMYL